FELAAALPRVMIAVVIFRSAGVRIAMTVSLTLVFVCGYFRKREREHTQQSDRSKAVSLHWFLSSGRHVTCHLQFSLASMSCRATITEVQCKNGKVVRNYGFEEACTR